MSQVTYSFNGCTQTSCVPEHEINLIAAKGCSFFTLYMHPKCR